MIPILKITATLISILGLSFCSAMAIAADSSLQNPAIKGAGSIYPAPNSENQPNPKSTYKIVFALGEGTRSPQKVNDGLEQLARAVNLYAAAGVPTDHMKFAGVFTLHGTYMLLSNEIYDNAYGTDNPNLKIINNLKEKGVKFFVDKQTISSLVKKYSDLKNSDFNESVPRVQSAITTIIEFQKNGYNLMLLPPFQQNINPEIWDQIMHPKPD